MIRWVPLFVGLGACSGGQTLGDAHVRGERTGLFQTVQHVRCTLDDVLRLSLDGRTGSPTSYSVTLPPPPDATRHPVVGTLERSLVEGPEEYERQVTVYAEISLGDPIEGATGDGVVVYVHQLVVPRSGDLNGRLNETVLGCSR